MCTSAQLLLGLNMEVVHVEEPEDGNWRVVMKNCNMPGEADRHEIEGQWEHSVSWPSGMAIPRMTWRRNVVDVAKPLVYRSIRHPPIFCFISLPEHVHIINFTLVTRYAFHARWARKCNSSSEGRGLNS
jgi:hypothetical protein